MNLKKMKLKKAGGTSLVLKKKLLLFFIIFLFFISKNSIGNIVNDYEIESLLKEMAQPLYDISNISKKESELVILLDNNPNAFVDASNRIFITTGLILFSDNPEGITGIIAHEIGHIKLLHVNKRSSKIKEEKATQAITNILSLSASLLSNNPTIFTGTSIASQEMVQSNLSHFSKDQEREADILGLDYLEKINISSLGLRSVLVKLIAVAEKMGIKEENLKLYTHPYKTERIELIDKLSKSSNYNNSYYKKEVQKKYKFIQAKISGYTLSLEDNQLKYNKNLDDNGKYALSISYARKGYMKESLKFINEIIKKYPENPFFYETKGEILLNFGYSYEAIKFFNKSLIIEDSNDYLRIKLIILLSNEIKKNANKIITEFNKLEIDTWKNNKLLSVIAKALETVSKADEMFLYLALIEINNNNFDLAKEYLAYAENNTTNNDTINKIKKIKKNLLND